jgi:hypothetical protein
MLVTAYQLPEALKELRPIILILTDTQAMRKLECPWTHPSPAKR